MNFNRENILDYQIAAVAKDHCIEEILTWIVAGRREQYFVCANPHFTEMASNGRASDKVLKSDDLTVPDSAGVMLASRLLGVGPTDATLRALLGL